MLTPDQQRIKIRDQLKRELFQADNAKLPTKKRANKPHGAIQSTRSKFLKNPNTRKEPNEKRQH